MNIYKSKIRKMKPTQCKILLNNLNSSKFHLSYLLMKSMACVFSWSALCRSASTNISQTFSIVRFEHRASSHITFKRSKAYWKTVVNSENELTDTYQSLGFQGLLEIKCSFNSFGFLSMNYLNRKLIMHAERFRAVSWSTKCPSMKYEFTHASNKITYIFVPTRGIWLKSFQKRSNYYNII